LGMQVAIGPTPIGKTYATCDIVDTALRNVDDNDGVFKARCDFPQLPVSATNRASGTIFLQQNDGESGVRMLANVTFLLPGGITTLVVQPFRYGDLYRRLNGSLYTISDGVYTSACADGLCAFTYTPEGDTAFPVSFVSEKTVTSMQLYTSSD